MEESKYIAVIQPIVPDYRLIFFEGLQERFPQLVVAAGDVGWSPGLRTDPRADKFRIPLKNSYWLGRTFRWQSGALKAGLDAELIIIEFNLRCVSTWLLLALRSARGKPSIMWGHASGRKSYMGWLRNWMFKRINGFIAYTVTQQKHLSQLYVGLPVWAAHNAVLRAQDCHAATNPQGEYTDFVFIGRLVREKKPVLLAKAFIDAVNRDLLPKEVRLVFVGAGPESAETARLAEEAGLQNRILHLGHISDSERLREIYSTALFSCSPGYVGLSATQSFAMGVPMLVAKNEPHSPEVEACLDGFNAIYFRSDDPVRLADTMGEVWSERDRWVAARPSIAKFTQNNYTFEHMWGTFSQAIEFGLSKAKPTEN